MYLIVDRCEDAPRMEFFISVNAVLQCIIELRDNGTTFLRDPPSNLDLEQFPSRTAYLFEAKSVLPE